VWTDDYNDYKIFSTFRFGLWKFISYLQTQCEIIKSNFETQKQTPCVIDVAIKNLFTPSSQKVCFVIYTTQFSISCFSTFQIILLILCSLLGVMNNWDSGIYINFVVLISNAFWQIVVVAFMHVERMKARFSLPRFSWHSVRRAGQQLELCYAVRTAQLSLQREERVAKRGSGVRGSAKGREKNLAICKEKLLRRPACETLRVCTSVPLTNKATSVKRLLTMWLWCVLAGRC
jgi:hypothetical protein